MIDHFVLSDGSIEKYDYNGLVNKPHIATCTVPTFEDLYDTTEDEVTVLQDDSYYGSGQTVTFMKSDVAMTAQPFFQRANGDYMVPKPRHDPPESTAPLISIGETIASYVCRDDLVYGNNTGLFSTECTNEIDCAMFSYAVLQGITYENSRYNGNSTNTIGEYVGDNIPRNQACYYSSNRPYALKASEQAVWFAEQNRLFYIDYEKEHPCSQLRPGDLLFESGEDGGLRYLLVHHVVVVLAVYPLSDIVLVAQAGGSHAGVVETPQPQKIDGTNNVCNLVSLKIKDEPTKHIVYARPNYGAEAKQPRSVVSQVGNVSSSSVGGTSPQYGSGMARMWTYGKLSTSKMYTLLVKGTLPKYSEDKAQIRLFGNTSTSGTKGMALSWHIENSDVLAFPFVPSKISEYCNSHDVSAFLSSTDYATSTVHTYSLDAVGLVEGLAPNATPNVLVSSSAFTAESGVTVSGAYVFRDEKGLHVRILLTLDTATSSSGNVKVGTINPDLMPTRANGYEKACTVGTQVRPVEVVPSSGDVRVWYASGEGASGNTIIDIVI